MMATRTPTIPTANMIVTTSPDVVRVLLRLMQTPFSSMQIIPGAQVSLAKTVGVQLDDLGPSEKHAVVVISTVVEQTNFVDVPVWLAAFTRVVVESVAVVDCGVLVVAAEVDSVDSVDSVVEASVVAGEVVGSGAVVLAVVFSEVVSFSVVFSLADVVFPFAVVFAVVVSSSSSALRRNSP